MGIIKKLKGKDLVGGTDIANTDVYPITHIGAIYDDNGNTLETLLDDMNEIIESGGGGGASGGGTSQATNYLWAYCAATDDDAAEDNWEYIKNSENNPPNGFVSTPGELELGANKSIYMITAMKTGSSYIKWQATHTVWSKPARIGNGTTSGTGVDSTGYNYVYCRTATSEIPGHLNKSVSEVENLGPNKGFDFYGNIVSQTGQPNVWYDHPSGISSEFPYEWISVAVYDGTTWSPYSDPVLWSKYGVDGKDGDGVEYIYMASSSDEDSPTWGISQDSITYYGRVGEDGGDYRSVNKESEYYQQDDFIPRGWHDEPQGLSTLVNVQYVSVRKREWISDEEKSKWGDFSTPVKWSELSTASPFTLTFDNDAVILDDNTDDQSVRNVSNTAVHVFYGSEDITTNLDAYRIAITVKAVNSIDSQFNFKRVSAMTSDSVTGVADLSELGAVEINNNTLCNGEIRFCLTRPSETTALTQGTYALKYIAEIYDRAAYTDSTSTPIATISRTQAVKVLDITDGVSYMLQVTPNTLPVYRVNSDENYVFRTGETTNVKVTAKACSTDGMLDVTLKDYGPGPSTEGVYIKFASHNNAGPTSYNYAELTSGNNSTELTYTLSDAGNRSLYYIANLIYKTSTAEFIIDTETVDFSIKGDDGKGAYTLTIDNDSAVIDSDTTVKEILKVGTLTSAHLYSGITDMSSDSLTEYYLGKCDLPEQLCVKDNNNSEQIVIPESSTLLRKDSNGGAAVFLDRVEGSTGDMTPGQYSVEIIAKYDGYKVDSKKFTFVVAVLEGTGTLFMLNVTPGSWTYRDNSVFYDPVDSVISVTRMSQDSGELTTASVPFTYGTNAPSASQEVYVQYPSGLTISEGEDANSKKLRQGNYDANGYTLKLYYKGIEVDSEHIDCLKDGDAGISFSLSTNTGVFTYNEQEDQFHPSSITVNIIPSNTQDYNFNYDVEVSDGRDCTAVVNGNSVIITPKARTVNGEIEIHGGGFTVSCKYSKKVGGSTQTVWGSLDFNYNVVKGNTWISQDGTSVRIGASAEDIDNLNTRMSEIEVNADSITSTVTRQMVGADNLFSFNEASVYSSSVDTILLPEHYGLVTKWHYPLVSGDQWKVIELNRRFEDSIYAFSMDIYSEATVPVTLIFQLTNALSRLTPSFSKEINQGDNHISFTLNTSGENNWTPSATTLLNFGIVSLPEGISQDFRIYIHNLKIENGNVITAFKISSVDENAISQGSLIDEWTTEAGKVAVDGTYNAMPVYKAMCNLENSTGTKWRLYKSDVTVKDKTCYTLSFWAKADVEGTEIQQNFYDHGGISRNDSSNMGQGYWGEINTTLTTQWKHYVHYWYTDFESAVVATVSWGENVTIYAGRMYKVNSPERNYSQLMWASYSENGELKNFNMQDVTDLESEASHFSLTVNNKTVVGLQITSTYGTIANPKYVYIAGLSFDEDYVGEGPSSSSSMIRQTADSITAQVGDISTRLDNGGFTITGNTVVNGDLTATRVITEDQGAGNIRLENGLLKVFNSSESLQLILGVDANGDVILTYYDSNGNILWSLGANGAYGLTSTDIVAESLVLQDYTNVNDWRPGYSYSDIGDIMDDNTLLHNLFTTSTSYTKCLWLYTAARSGDNIAASGRYTWADSVQKATDHDGRYHTNSNGTYANGSFYTTNNGSMLFREIIQDPHTPQGTIDYIYTKKVVHMGPRGRISETYNIKEIHYTDSSEVTYLYE